MSVLRSPYLLRYALIADAVGSGAVAVLLLIGSAALSPLLGLPEELLNGVGIALVPWVLGVGFLASMSQPPAGAIWTVIALNVATAGSAVLALFAAGLSPTMLGYAFVLTQAAAVLAFADFQFFGLRNVSATA